jgi:hypothetical protein
MCIQNIPGFPDLALDVNACAIKEQVLLITVVIAPAYMQEAIEGNNLISIMEHFQY